MFFLIRERWKLTRLIDHPDMESRKTVELQTCQKSRRPGDLISQLQSLVLEGHPSDFLRPLIEDRHSTVAVLPIYPGLSSWAKSPPFIPLLTRRRQVACSHGTPGQAG
jgi:hypothetical protein